MDENDKTPEEQIPEETSDTVTSANENDDNPVPEKKQTGINPVIWTTRVILFLAFLIFIWYIYSDRRTPYTSQARITELVIPVTPRVSGYLTGVYVKLHSPVKAGQLLFQIDTIPYVLAIQKAQANLDNVIQQLGAQGAAVKAAASSVGVSKANLDRAQRNYNRAQRIIKKNPGALSQADIDRVETNLNQAIEKLANAEANLQKAKEQLGVTGADNPQLRMALSDLDNARLNLSWTKVYAPADGHIESFNIDVGYFCQAGAPLVTLVSKEDLWIQADFKENNLTNMKPGDKVDFILDVEPGQIFHGRVRSIGHGVDVGNTVNRGGLPQIKSTSSWLQDPQRFPVIIEFDNDEVNRIVRAGGQADVVVYTGDHSFLNAVAKFRIWINSKLSYVR
jgi:multidrug resistance efflux pump